jgi:pyridoxal phosphate enzyme (YggS family)
MSGFDTISDEGLAEARVRYEAVRERIARAAERAGRGPDEVTLVGVAKRQPDERVLAALAAGLRVLGQSYIQEARRVRPTIEAALDGDPAAPCAPGELRWHMVGRLQRNKAGLAARLFEVVESVDRPELAASLARRAENEGRNLDVLIQLSLCGEPQKGGCEPEALPALAEQILGLPSLRLRGLMTVPSANPDPERARPAFRRLHGLREELAALDPSLARSELSMGMSADLEVAVEEGATLVRVGTALFGERVDPTTGR